MVVEAVKYAREKQYQNNAFMPICKKHNAQKYRNAGCFVWWATQWEMNGNKFHPKKP